MTPADSNTTKFVTLILNPIKVDAAELSASVRDVSAQHGWAEPHFIETTVEDPGQGATRKALADGASVVLVAGGDGTVRSVSEAMAGSDVPLVIVPSGTGNLLARNLMLPIDDVDACVSAAFTGSAARVDVGFAAVTRADGKTEEHAFVVMAGMGLDAAMIRNTNPDLKKRVGWMAYIDGAARSLTASKPFRVMFQVSGEHIRHTRAHSVLWANCGQLPGGIDLIPQASIRDGMMDIAVFQPNRWWHWFFVWRTVWWHNSVLRRTKAGRTIVDRRREDGAVRYYQGEQMEVVVSAPQPIELDGDEFGEATRLVGRIERDALLTLLPAKSLESIR